MSYGPQAFHPMAERVVPRRSRSSCDEAAHPTTKPLVSMTKPFILWRSRSSYDEAVRPVSKPFILRRSRSSHGEAVHRTPKRFVP